jgi:hypothetical protein
MIVVRIILAAVARALHTHVTAGFKILHAVSRRLAVHAENLSEPRKAGPRQHVLLAVHVQTNGDGYPQPCARKLGIGGDLD